MIYVDPLMGCAPTDRWPWNQSCHLFADHTSELHAFAADLGLKREWFQDTGKTPHYDLTAGKRAAAIRLGARDLTREEAVSKWRAASHDPAQLPLL